MTTKMISNYAKAVKFGKPFYASDIQLNSGAINTLSYAGLIQPTGKTRTIYVDLGDDYAKKVTVKEWVVNLNAAHTILDDCAKILNDIQTIVNIVNTLT